MQYISNEEYYNDVNDDDFDVDFGDDLGYNNDPKPKKPEKKESKTTKSSSKKEIKVATKKTKKTPTKTKVVKKSLDTEVEPAKTVKKTAKSSSDSKTTKKATSDSKKDKTISVQVKKKKTTKTVKKTEKPLETEKKEEPKKSEEKKPETKKVVKKHKTKKVVKKEEPKKPKVKPITDDFSEEVDVEVEEKTEVEIYKPKEEEPSKIITESEKTEEVIKEKSKETSEELKTKFSDIFAKIKSARMPMYLGVSVLVICLLAFVLIKTGILSITIGKKEEDTVQVIPEDEVNEYREVFDKYEEINSDHVGQIVFDSKLIDRPFVQAKSCYKENGVPYKFFNQDGSIVTDFSDKTGNDVYIWMDFETMKYDYDNKGGSIFMDYRNTLSDQNIIIYGHYFSTIYNKDPDRIKSFTPLEKLLDKENYKDNSVVKIVLDGEVREYELYAVYKFNSDDDEFWEKGQYFRPNYNIDDFTGEEDANYMNNYIKFVDKVKLYKTNVKLEPGDKTLTLQTCMTPYTNLYEICVFKLVNTYSY